MFNGLSWQWPGNPWAGAVLLALCLLYGLGLWQARRRGSSVTLPRIILFYLGVVLTALVLLTPLETIGRTQLFLVHMIQVVALTTLCAPLLMAGCPEELLRPVLETPTVRRILLTLTRPLLASILFNAVFLLWHMPKIFALVQANEILYHVMMINIFLASFLNWHPIIGPIEENRQLSYPMRLFYTFVDGQPVDIFAFVLLFTQVALYSYAIPLQMHLSGLADQEIGGALLLIPGLVDLGVMTPFFFGWLKQIEEHAIQNDQKRQADFEAQDEGEEDDDETIEEEEEELSYDPRGSQTIF